MTARRKDNGDLEEVNWGGKTITYRTILFAAIISATPLGEPFWKVLGLPSAPTANAVEIERRVSVVERKVDTVEQKVQSVERKVDMALIDINLVSSKLTGFIVDFEKYRKEGK